MTHYDVFCYGEIGVDNIIRVSQLPTPEIAVFPTADSYHIGGAAANTAVWLAHLGLSVGLTGNVLGEDLYGQQLRGWLSAYPSLDLSYVEWREDIRTPFCRAMVTPDAERSFLIFWYPQTPKTPLKADMLHGAQFVALDLYGGGERIEAAKVARQMGAKVTIGDVIWPDHAALPLTDIVTNSGTYIRTTFPGIDVRQHARRLQAIGRGIVITTDGPDEVYVIDAGGAAFVVLPPQVEAVDATGAGDAFRAGLLYGLAQGWDLPRSVCWGVATGTLKVQRVGAASDLPPVDEIAALAATLTHSPAD